MKDVPSTVRPGDVCDFIVDSTGGFSVATDTNDNFVSATHDAVRHFAGWVPENAQQRRFKAMVECLETKAMEEEDDYNFSQGCANGDFANPI
jgi:hypothetical protein